MRCLTPLAEVEIQSAEYLEKDYLKDSPVVVSNSHRLLCHIIALIQNELKIHCYIQCLPGDADKTPLPYVLVTKRSGKRKELRVICSAYLAGMSSYHCF